jgi:hypothetical protein
MCYVYMLLYSDTCIVCMYIHTSVDITVLVMHKHAYIVCVVLCMCNSVEALCINGLRLIEVALYGMHKRCINEYV